MKLHSTKFYQSPIALKGLELLLDGTFVIAPAKHEVLNRLKEHIDTKYQMPKELELKASKKSIKSQQLNKDPQRETNCSPERSARGPMVKIWIHKDS